jgi:hypothetical protein
LAVVLFVFLVVAAIASKKPGIAWAAALVPLVLVALAFVVAPTSHSWTSDSSMDHVDFHLSSGVPADVVPAPMHVSGGGITILGLLLIAGLIAGVLLVVTRASGKHGQSGQGGGWGKALVLLLVVFVGAKLWATRSPENIAHQQREHARQEMQRVAQQLDKARQDVEQAAKEASATGQGSMQELWEQVNKPRIVIESDGQTAVVEASDGEQTVKMETNAETGAKVVVVDKKPADEAEAAEQAAEAVEEATDEQATDEQVASESSANKEPDRGRGRPGSLSEEGQSRPASQEPVATTTKDSSDENASMPRPAWVDLPPKRVGQVWREVVVTDEFATADECYQQANQLLIQATMNHIRTLTGEGGLGRPSGAIPAEVSAVVAISYARSSLANIGVGIDYIRRQIVPEDGEYMETVDRSFGPMKKLYTQLEFTPSVDCVLTEHWRAYEREKRLMAVGGIGGLLVGVVGLAYGLLKVDTWTKGYYTKRLFLGVPAAIIGFIALGVAMIGV